MHPGLLLLSAATKTSLTPGLRRGSQGEGAPLARAPPLSVQRGCPGSRRTWPKLKWRGRGRAYTSIAACRAPLSCRPAHEGAPPTGQVLSPPVQPRSPGCLSWDPWLWLSPPPPSLTWEEASAGDLWILCFHQYCISLRGLGPQLTAPSRRAEPAPASVRQESWCGNSPASGEWLAPPAARCSLREKREAPGPTLRPKRAPEAHWTHQLKAKGLHLNAPCQPSAQTQTGGAGVGRRQTSPPTLHHRWSVWMGWVPLACRSFGGLHT